MANTNQNLERRFSPILNGEIYPTREEYLAFPGKGIDHYITRISRAVPRNAGLIPRKDYNECVKLARRGMMKIALANVIEVSIPIIAGMYVLSNYLSR
jgi:hypothetical protein